MAGAARCPAAGGRAAARVVAGDPPQLRGRGAGAGHGGLLHDGGRRRRGVGAGAQQRAGVRHAGDAVAGPGRGDPRARSADDVGAAARPGLRHVLEGDVAHRDHRRGRERAGRRRARRCRRDRTRRGHPRLRTALPFGGRRTAAANRRRLPGRCARHGRVTEDGAQRRVRTARRCRGRLLPRAEPGASRSVPGARRSPSATRRRQ